MLVERVQRLLRDTCVWLLIGEVVLELAMQRPLEPAGRAWAAAGWGLTALLLVAVVARRIRGLPLGGALTQGAPVVLVLVAACWRAAEGSGVNAPGVLGLIAVMWVALNADLRRSLVLVGVLGALLLTAPLVGPDHALTADEVTRACLIVVVAVPLAIAMNGLARRGDAALERVAQMHPKTITLDAVLRAATEHMVIVRGLDGIITVFSSGAERMLGWSAEEVIGLQSPLVFVDPEEMLKRAAQLGLTPGLDVLNVFAHREDAHLSDWAMRTKDGRRIVVSLTTSLMRSESGAVVGAVTIGTDVTAARTAARTLETQQRLYQILVDHLPQTVVGLCDEALNWITIGGETLDAVSPELMAGESGGSSGHSIDATQFREFVRQSFANPGRRRFEDQSGQTFEVDTLLVRGLEGERLILAVGRNITDMVKAAEEQHELLAALEASTRRFRESFTASPVGIAVVSLGADGPEHLLQVNPAFAATLGRSADELVGSRLDDLLHPSDRLGEWESAGPTPQRSRVRFLRPSGRAVWAELTSVVVHESAGTPAHLVVYVQDIHALKQSERALLDALEQQRAATESLRELAQLRAEMMGTISHELRTPLTSISGYLEMLADEPLERSQLDMVDVAMRNAHRIGKLIDNLLVLVRLDEDRLATGDDEPVSIEEVMDAAVASIRPSVEERAQRLVVHRLPSDVVVQGDADQLERVLLNLLSNASKYTPSHGNLELRAEQRGEMVLIEVSDDGIGIPPEEQPLLFSRFFRASAARESSVIGHGLGLAIVKSIVERHQGDVSVRSDPGRGSTFCVTLPIVAPTATGRPSSRTHQVSRLAV